MTRRFRKGLPLWTGGHSAQPVHVADHGNLYYYLFREWPPDPEKFINLSVEIFSTEDRARMAPVLAGDAYRFWFAEDS